MTDRPSATGAATGAAPDPNPAVPTSSEPTATAHQRLASFWQTYAFSIGDIDFCRLDVALAAMAFGEWAEFERRLTEGLACAARAAAEHTPLPQSAIDDAAIAFRYARDLISGEDVSGWLDHAGISADEWMSCMTRDVYRQMWAGEIEEIIDRYSPSPRQLAAAAVPEGMCSGLFDRFEYAFSGRAATVCDLDRSFFQATAQPAPPSEFASRLARQHAHWLQGQVPADTLARLSLLVSIRDRYCAASEQMVMETALLEVIEAHRVEWVVLDVDTLSFADESAAREAVLCVTEDRLSLVNVGELSRHRVTRTRSMLGDFPEEHRSRLLAAEPGRVMGPMLVGDRFQVAAVVARTAPSLDDAQVVERARTAVLEQTAWRAAREHVTRKRP